MPAQIPCEKSSSLSQNTLGQSDCRIFKSAEQNYEIAFF